MSSFGKPRFMIREWSSHSLDAIVVLGAQGSRANFFNFIAQAACAMAVS